jgi:hypothetical protein
MDGGFFLAFYHEEFEQNIKGVMLIGYEQRMNQSVGASSSASSNYRRKP